eukprot:scaffold106463_cov60-Phaeocystis_antarctica.AAC.1
MAHSDSAPSAGAMVLVVKVHAVGARCSWPSELCGGSIRACARWLSPAGSKMFITCWGNVYPMVALPGIDLSGSAGACRPSRPPAFELTFVRGFPHRPPVTRF